MSAPLTHPYWIDQLGEAVEFYRGPLEFADADDAVADDSRVWLGWFPSPRLFVTWGSSSTNIQRMMRGPDRLTLRLPNGGGAGHVDLGGSPDLPVSCEPFGPHTVTRSGSLDDFLVGVDTDVDEARFLVINGPELHGTGLADDRGEWSGRVELASTEWQIVLDQRPTMNATAKDLKWQHQYGFTHIGCIKRVDGSSFGVEATNDALDLVSYFLSFVKGSSVSAVLPCGLNAAAETVWEDWGSVKRTVHPSRTPISWFDATLTHELPGLFQGFSQRWHAPDDQRVLRYATAFYQEGNDPRPLQTALNSAVSGLELMAWVNLVRDGGMDRSAFEEPGVRPKTFRSLLGTIGVDTRTVPTDFPELRRSGRLGHDAVWHWRGRFTHPRIGEIEVDHDLLTETWLVATWYLELVLLSWFGYNGEYGRRRKTGRWVGNTETVPWVST